MIDYPYANFGDFSFSDFCFITRTHTQTERERESQRRTNAIATDATTVDVSDKLQQCRML